MPEPEQHDWAHAARRFSAEKWRQPSAMMGSALTAALVEAAQPAAGLDVLDLASGTGEPAISLAARVLPGRVFATDITVDGLHVARERAARKNLGNITFTRADAHSLPFPDARFDRVTSRLGIMFFADFPRALAEVHRVLRPAGRLAFAAWGAMEQPYFSATIGVVRQHLPALEVPPGARALFRFADAQDLAATLTRAGFAGVQAEPRTVAWTWPGTVEEVWEYFRDVTLPFRPMLNQIPPEKKAAIDAAVHAALRPYWDGHQVNLTATFTFATARRP